jgi:hypothetical protein
VNQIHQSRIIKRKNADESEPTSNHSKRPRESFSRPRHLDTSNTPTRSLPETIPEALDELSIAPRTPIEQNFAADPTTPTPHAPSGTATTPKAREEGQSPAEAPPATPSNLSKKLPLSSAYTPMKLSSSNADPGCFPPSQSSSLANRHLDARNAPQLSQSSKQSRDSNQVAQLDAKNMEAILKHELFGAVFQHDKFYEEFLRVFGFSLCGSIVNFVCFDRSGLLHSPDIKLSTPDDADSFVQHVVTLLTLPAEKFGYDTRYPFHQHSHKKIMQTLFRFPGRKGEQAVNDVLCHRKCCCGRATCVSVLGDDVHKSIWRPEDRPDEGVTLSQFKGVFGVCQVLAYDHSTYSTKLEHPDALRVSPSASFFFPSSRNKSVAGSLASIKSKSASAQPSSPSQIPAPGSVPASPVSRRVRVKSDILMLRGTSLFEAQNPLHLLYAIHDALMGKCDSPLPLSSPITHV